jgi:hypothetical protein
MMGVAALWIAHHAVGGGMALDRLQSNAITRNFDDGMSYA